jgi:uncharacterized protein (TIGR00645 family)
MPVLSGRMNERAVERNIERVIFASRWLLAPMFLGLAVALAVYVLRFFVELWHVVQLAFRLDDVNMLLAVLSLVDAALVGSLLAMVIISGYENFVSHIDTEGKSDRLSWFGKLDAGSLKIKLASSIVAISSIHLLQRFLEAGDFENSKLYALVVMHMAFVVSALMLTYIDRIASSKPGGH